MPTTVDQLLADARASLGRRMTPIEAASALSEGALLIDIRSDRQRESDGEIEEAIVIPRNSLEWRCDLSSPWHHPRIIDHQQRLILICNEGFQSSLAAATLRQLGMRHATDVAGGFIAWRAAGMPVIGGPYTMQKADDALKRQTEAHWDSRYQELGAEKVSWYEREPHLSLELIDRLRLRKDTPIVDVGGGASALIPTLAERGFSDLTLLDISEAALQFVRSRNPQLSVGARLLQQDVLSWQPEQRYGLWHDRAVFHFFTDVEQRARYLSVVKAAVVPDGHVIIGAFAADGPEQCSGLPVMRYAAAELSGLFAFEFEMVHEQREVHRTPSGVMQPFQWVVLRRRLT